jgi:hypothetical protein
MCVKLKGWTLTQAVHPVWVWWYYLDECGCIALQVGRLILELSRPQRRTDR